MKSILLFHDLSSAKILGGLILGRGMISSRFREANRFFRSQSAGLPESAGDAFRVIGAYSGVTELGCAEVWKKE